MSTEWIVGIVFGVILLVSFLGSIPVMYRYVKAEDEALKASKLSQGEYNETKTFEDSLMELSMKTSVVLIPSLYVASVLYKRDEKKRERAEESA